MNLLIPILIAIPATYVASSRGRVAKDVQKDLVKIADFMFEAARQKSKQGDLELLKLYNLILELALLTPGIAGGVVVQDKNQSINEEDRQAFENYLERNAWLLGYLFTVTFLLKRLEFHAKPLSLKRMRASAIANLALIFFSDEQKVIKIVWNPARTEQRVETMASYAANLSVA